MASQAFVRVVADTSDVDRQLTEGMNRAIRDVEDRLPEIDVDAEIDPDSIRDMTSTMRRTIRDIEAAAGEIDVEVGLDQRSIATARAQVQRLQQDLSGIDISLHPEIDPASLARARADVANLDRQLRELDDVHIDIDIDRDELRGASDDTDNLDTSFLRVISSVGRLAALAPVALAPLISTLGATISAVQSAVAAFGGFNSIVNQAAGLGAIFAASNAVLRLSLMGVSDALTAAFGSAEDFNEALEKLSPEAQRVLTAFRTTVPVLKEFQQSLQDALFKQIESGTVTQFAKSVQSIQPAATGVATAFGKVGQQLLELVNKKSVLDDINTILRAAAPLIEKVGTFLVGKLGGALDRAAKGTADLGGSFTVLKAVFDTLKTAASDIGRILGAIGDASTRAGGSLSGPLFAGLSAVADAFESPAGAKFLDTMIQLANTLGGILAEALGTALSILLPFIQQVGAYLNLILEPLGRLVNAILPVLNPLFIALGAILQAMGPFVQQVGNAVMTLLGPALAVLPGILNQILQPLIRIAQQIFPMLTKAITDNKPLLDQLGRDFAALLVQLAPFVAKIVQLALSSLPAFAGAITATLPLVLKFIDYIVRVVTALVQSATAVKTWGSNLVSTVTSTGVKFAASVYSWTVKSATSITNFISKSRSAIMSWAADLYARATSAMARFNTSINAGIVKAVNYIRSLPSKIRGALGNAGSILYNIGRSIISGLINGITSRVASLTSTLRSITSKIPSWKGPMDVDKKLLTPNGQEVMNGFMRGIQAQVPELRSQLRGLTAALPSMAVNNTVASPASAMAQGVSTVNATVNPVIQNQVYIDGQQVRVIADQQIVRNNQTRDRLAAQGVRR